MKKQITIGFLILIGAITRTQAQVGMMTNTPNNNATLDLNMANGTNTKGLLLPKVALTALGDASPLKAHTAGMHVYNTATGATGITPGEYYNDGTQWLRLQTNAWELNTNSGTDPTKHFAGTTDATDLVFRTNNTERMRIKSNLLFGPNSGTQRPVTIMNGTIQIKDGSQCDGCIMVSDANGVGTWFEPGNSALGTGKYNCNVPQTFPNATGAILQTTQPIKLAVGGTYMTSIRWWGTSNGPNIYKQISAYFYLYKNGVLMDSIEYYVPLANSGASFSLTVNLLALNCSAGDVLTIKVSPSIGGATAGTGTWYTGTSGSGLDPRWMPSVVVSKL
jgi:hypothetical protein